MMQMYKSKIFGNGSTLLLKPVRDALGVKKGDSVSYVISEDSVQVLRTRSARELACRLARDGKAPVSLDAMVTAIFEGAIESGK